MSRRLSQTKRRHSFSSLKEVTLEMEATSKADAGTTMGEGESRKRAFSPNVGGGSISGNSPKRAALEGDALSPTVGTSGDDYVCLPAG